MFMCVRFLEAAEPFRGRPPDRPNAGTNNTIEPPCGCGVCSVFLSLAFAGTLVAKAPSPALLTGFVAARSAHNLAYLLQPITGNGAFKTLVSHSSPWFGVVVPRFRGFGLRKLFG